MKKIILSIFALTVISTSVNAQNVNIPDANFKTYLVGNAAINTNGDTEIQVSEANAFAGGINCSFLSISDMTGIEAFTNIIVLDCSNNYQLTSLDVTNNPELSTLYCSFGLLSTLDLSANTNLEYLSVAANDLTTLDVTNSTNLVQLSCQNNELTSLFVGSTNITTNFNASNNPNLSCIQVIDVAYSTANWTNIDTGTSFSTNCNTAPCTVTIPDANFKAALVGNASINTNGDAEIQCAEATAFTGFMNIENQNISDLTGIEAFTNMINFRCNNNNLTSLDLSANTAIVYLKCNSNNLTNINISGLTNLENLESYNNSLTNIDVSGLTSLLSLKCYNNNLTNLNTSGATALEGILCHNNNLTTLDVSTNTSLLELICTNNNLTSLNTSGVTALEQLYCSDNAITSLDFSTNTNLYHIIVNNNALTSLNVANGFNSNTLTSNFNAANNPNLTCIQVDNVAYSTTNWTNIDATVSFSENCLGSGVGINEFDSKNISIYPNPAINELFVDVAEGQINQLQIIDYTGRVVTSISDKQGKIIDVSRLTQGIYILKVSTENGISTQQFIKK